MQRNNGHIASTSTALRSETDHRAPRLALSREEAAYAISVSPRLVDSLIADRSSGFPVRRVHNRVVIPVRELTEWLAAQVTD